MRTLILVFSFLFSLSLLSQNTAPDFTLTDTDGVEHNLYADYLDQGKTVILHIGATWSPFDPLLLEENILQDFQSEYVPSGAAAVLFIDPNSPSIDDLMGTGNNNLTGYDYISGCNFPVISADTSFMDLYDVLWFPTIRIICPDRTLHSDENDDSIFYGELASPEYIADKMYEYCGTEFNLATIDGQVYVDEDINCTFDTPEATVQNIKALVDGPNGTFTRYTSDAGIFRMLAAEGDYTINLCPPNDFWTVCNNPQMLTISSNDQEEDIEFGLQSNLDCSKMEAQITSPILRRCFTSQVIVDYCNNGTIEAQDAFLEVELDEFMIFENSVPDPSSVTGNILRYELGNVSSLECGRVHIFVEISCDTILGLEQCYSVTYGPFENCDNKDDDKDTECQEIRGAYDPNDKRAFPLSGSDDYTILPNEEIKYQIRFQNTGTDTAFNIVVEDVLSPFLDLSSFRIGQSSHPYEVTIDERRKAVFRFDNIMLPDSNVNLVGSNGFLNYYIKQKEDLANGTHITNEAAIYFDFNEPIWTNVTDHEVDDGISSTRTPQDELSFSLTPNPAEDYIVLSVADPAWARGTATIMDFNGKTLVTQQMSSSDLSMDIGGLESGLYLVHLRAPSGLQGTHKLTVIK